MKRKVILVISIITVVVAGFTAGYYTHNYTKQLVAEQPTEQLEVRHSTVPAEVTTSSLVLVPFDEVAKHLTLINGGSIVTKPEAPDLWFGLVTDTGSMEPTLSDGMVVLFQRVKSPSELAVGDIISYFNPVTGDNIAHRIVSIDIGPPWTCRTQGDANSMADSWTVYFDYVFGIYKGYLTYDEP